MRSRAVTLGQIASIQFARGDVDAALTSAAAWLDGVRKLDVSREIAVAQFQIAQMELQAGKPEHVIERLAESFSRMRALRIPGGVAVVGEVLGQILVQVGHPEAGDVLREAQAAAAARGGREAVGRIGSLLASLASGGAGDDAGGRADAEA